MTFFAIAIIGTILTSIINRFKKSKDSDNCLLRLISSFSVFENHRHLFSPYKDRLWSCECINLVFMSWYNMSITYAGMIMAGLVGARKLFNSYAIDAATDPEYWWLRTTLHRDSLFMIRLLDNFHNDMAKGEHFENQPEPFNKLYFNNSKLEVSG